MVSDTVCLNPYADHEDMCVTDFCFFVYNKVDRDGLGQEAGSFGLAPPNAELNGPNFFGTLIE